MPFHSPEVLDNEGVPCQLVPDCPLCGAAGERLYSGLRDRLFDAAGSWGLRGCAHCQLIWADPRPTPVGLDLLYQRYYTHDASPPRASATQRIRLLFEREIGPAVLGYDPPRRSRLGRLLGSLGMFREVGASTLLWLPASSRGRVLDVGCGSGKLLLDLRAQGWQVAGVEPDPAAARAARQQHGLDVHVGTLASAPPAWRDFDAITMHHVIEHVADPVELLAEARSRLAAGGLLIVATPNPRSLTRYLFGRSWLGWDPPRHLLLLTRHSLRECAARAGFTAVEVRTSARYSFVCWAGSRAIRRHGRVRGGGQLAWSVSVGGLLMQATQHAAQRWRPDAGEEVLLFARR